MSRSGASLILLIASLHALVCVAQSSPDPSSQTNPPMVLPIPSLPDIPLPDAVSFPRHDDKTQSSIKRIVNRINPICLGCSFIVGCTRRTTTLLQRPKRNGSSLRIFEVGDIYFCEKNYKAAESRFREALEYKPDQPETTYKLAVSVEKLGKTDDALELYQSYLKLAPSGPYADRARKAI